MKHLASLLALSLLVTPVRAGVPFMDPGSGVAMTFPDGWGSRVVGPGAAARQFGPIGDPDFTVLLSVTSLPKGKAIDTEQIKKAALKGISDTGAKLKEVPWEAKIPGVTPVAWGYNFKPSDGKLYAMRMAVFFVPDGERESMVHLQVVFLASKAPVVKAQLPGVLASMKFAGVPPSDPVLKLATEQRACLSNLRVITGAAEMWSLDKKKPWDALTPELVNELQSGQYLQAYPDDPGQPRGSSTNYYKLPGKAQVACKVHGDIEGAVAGSQPRAAPPPDPPLDFVLYRMMKGEVAKANCQLLVNELSGGLAMFRLETNKFDEALTPDVAKKMFQKGLLRRVMTVEDPGEGEGSEKNFASEGSAVVCKTHGTRSK